MITKPIDIKRGNRQAADYFRPICTDFRKMYNCALFYITNNLSGWKKEPQDRYDKEKEAIEYTLEGIRRYNKKKLTSFCKKVRSAGHLLLVGMMTGSMAMACVRKSFPVYMDLPCRERSFLSYEQLNAIFSMMEHPVYKRMPAQVNQNAIRKAAMAWKGYFKALKAYEKEPGKFTAKPKRPHYAKDEMTAWFTNQTARAKEIDGKWYISFINSRLVLPVGRLEGRLIKTEVCPLYGSYRVLVTTEKDIREVPVPENASRFFGVDIGLGNLAAVANNVGSIPFLIRGTAAKSINQWFNKRKAKLISDLTRGKDSTHSEKHSRAFHALSRERDNRLRDFFYKAAHYICRQAVAQGIRVIIAGHNEGQKDGINLGHENNQAFVSVPYTKFLLILKHTAWKNGIAFLQTEESYTSKASLLDLDEIPVYKKDDGKAYVFSGKRKHRGLYVSADGTALNADINGAGNIIRKVYPDAFKSGQDLSFLHKTTATIGYKDLYPVGDPKKNASGLAAAKKHRHNPSALSRSAHFYHSQKKMELLRVFSPKETEQESIDAA